jgi:hypothetical protein
MESRFVPKVQPDESVSRREELIAIESDPSEAQVVGAGLQSVQPVRVTEEPAATVLPPPLTPKKKVTVPFSPVAFGQYRALYMICGNVPVVLPEPEVFSMKEMVLSMTAKKAVREFGEAADRAI